MQCPMVSVAAAPSRRAQRANRSPVRMPPERILAKMTLLECGMHLEAASVRSTSSKAMPSASLRCSVRAIQAAERISTLRWCFQPWSSLPSCGMGSALRLPKRRQPSRSVRRPNCSSRANTWVGPPAISRTGKFQGLTYCTNSTSARAQGSKVCQGLSTCNTAITALGPVTREGARKRRVANLQACSAVRSNLNFQLWYSKRGARIVAKTAARQCAGKPRAAALSRAL
eukprot:6202968-Amphidinium_carterae.4